MLLAKAGILPYPSKPHKTPWEESGKESPHSATESRLGGVPQLRTPRDRGVGGVNLSKTNRAN